MPTGIYQHKPHSEETKKKLAIASGSRKHTLESRRKMGKAKKGISIKHSGQFKKGHKAWNFKSGQEIKRKFLRVNGKPTLNAHKVWLEYNQLDKIPEGFVIHHKDENPLNDDISNLRFMRKEDHNYLHQVLDRERALVNEKVRLLKEAFKKMDSGNGYLTSMGVNKKINKIFGERLT